MKKITLYVEDEQKEYLQKKVGNTGSMSWYIRKLLDSDMIRRNKVPRLRKAIFPTVSQNQ